MITTDTWRYYLKGQIMHLAQGEITLYADRNGWYYGVVDGWEIRVAYMALEPGSLN